MSQQLLIRSLPKLQAKDPLTAEIIQDVVNALQQVADQVNGALAGEFSPPPQISALSVTAAGGIFDIQITDNNPVFRGIHYFVEYSTSAAFAQPLVMALGASRNARVNWGNQTFYFRAYSQYLTSAPSAPVYFGPSNNPTGVSGGGAIMGPNPQTSTGSGTAPSDGRTGGAGFGVDPIRGTGQRR